MISKYTWNNSERWQYIRVLQIPYTFPIMHRPAMDRSVTRWVMWPASRQACGSRCTHRVHLHQNWANPHQHPTARTKNALKWNQNQVLIGSSGVKESTDKHEHEYADSPLQALFPQRSWSGWVYAEVRSWLGWRERPERLRSTSPPTAGRYTTTEWWWTCSYAKSSPECQTSYT